MRPLNMRQPGGQHQIVAERVRPRSKRPSVCTRARSRAGQHRHGALGPCEEAPARRTTRCARPARAARSRPASVGPPSHSTLADAGCAQRAPARRADRVRALIRARRRRRLGDAVSAAKAGGGRPARVRSSARSCRRRIRGRLQHAARQRHRRGLADDDARVGLARACGADARSAADRRRAPSRRRPSPRRARRAVRRQALARVLAGDALTLPRRGATKPSSDIAIFSVTNGSASAIVNAKRSISARLRRIVDDLDRDARVAHARDAACRASPVRIDRADDDARDPGVDQRDAAGRHRRFVIVRLERDVHRRAAHVFAGFARRRASASASACASPLR